MFDLTDKVALVTGGSRGLGRAIALALAGQGADVAINYRGNADAAEAAAAEIRGLGRRAVVVRGDTGAGREACEAIVKAALDEFGKVDILVNNAGITRDNLIMRMDAEEWDSVIDTNLAGPFWMTRAIARPMLKARAGRIINMSSVAGRMGNVGQANYAERQGGAHRPHQVGRPRAGQPRHHLQRHRAGPDRDRADRRPAAGRDRGAHGDDAAGLHRLGR